MSKENFHHLHYFMTIANKKSFSQAALALGTSQSTLSHALKKLEDRLGVRLLNRTTRSVALTSAGVELLEKVQPSFQNIDRALEELQDYRVKPAGVIRLAAPEMAVKKILAPKITHIIKSYPGISFEIDVTLEVRDIVEKKYDAGICIGEMLQKDMIAIPIDFTMKMIALATPRYLTFNSFNGHPSDLTNHLCLSYRRPSSGKIYNWEFYKNGERFIHVPDKAICLNNANSLIDFALQDAGIVCVPDVIAERYLATGELVSVLPGWCVPFEGYRLYYSNRRSPTRAFKILIDALKI